MPSFHMSLPQPPPSVAPPSPPLSTVDLPVRPVPGSHGWPLIGPFADRLDYYWFQKPEAFFKKRIEKYKSTVFRTNVPPSFPFFTGVNPNVVALLDCKSFAHLFDVDLIDKKDVLVGEFMPSVAYTGNMRVGVYQDTTEPQHPKVRLNSQPSQFYFRFELIKCSQKLNILTTYTFFLAYILGWHLFDY